MARLFPIASLSIVVALPLSAQTASQPDNWRITEMPAVEHSTWRVRAAEVGPNARFGLGVFGLKPQGMRQHRVTGREFLTPRDRRAGVGFSIKF